MNWDLLLATLRGMPEFSRMQTTVDYNSWSSFLFALETSKNIDDLTSALSKIRSGMSSNFSPEEIQRLNLAFSTCGFNIVLRTKMPNDGFGTLKA